MNIIEVKNLSKHYKTYERGSGFKETIKSFFKRKNIVVKAVDDISFNINKGEICGILGPNGAGKSTSIKMLCGALFPTSGSVSVNGFNPFANRKKYVNEIGAVFGQKSQLIWDIPPIDSFNMNKAIYGVSDSNFDTRLEELSSLFDVKEIMKKPTRVLSLGERMKCEFIMAMLHEPKIVFLDEPTIGLDVIAKQKIRNFIKNMNEKGTTFILTTHDLEDVEQLANKVIIINHGKKVFDGTLSSLKQTLGNKKIINLVLEKPYRGTDIDGIRLIEQKSEQEIVVEVDTDKISVDSLLSTISKHVKFTDISIKGLPMEDIITKIYNDK